MRGLGEKTREKRREIRVERGEMRRERRKEKWGERDEMRWNIREQRIGKWERKRVEEERRWKEENAILIENGLLEVIWDIKSYSLRKLFD